MSSFSSAYKALGVVHCIVGGGGLVLFLLRRREWPIKTRGWWLVLLSNLWGIYHPAFVLFANAAASEDRPINCDAITWSSSLFVVFWSTPYYIRAHMMYFNSRYSEAKARLSQSEGERVISAQSDLEWFQRHLYLVRPPFLALLYLLVTGFFVVFFLILQYAVSYDPPYQVSSCVGAQIFNLALQAIVATILILIYFIKMRHVQEAFYLKTEMNLALVVTIPFYILYPVSIIVGLEFVDKIAAVAPPFLLFFVTLYLPSFLSFDRFRRRPSFPLGFSSLELTANQAMEGPEKELEPPFHSPSPSPSPSPLPYPSLTFSPGGRNESAFRFILSNEIALESLINFSIKSWCVENILFYVESSVYQELASAEERAMKAAHIIQTFILPQAPLEINVESAVRSAVLEAYQIGGMEPGLFLACQEHIFGVMLEDTFPNWARTPEFEEVLRAIMVGAQTPPGARREKRARKERRGKKEKREKRERKKEGEGEGEGEGEAGVRGQTKQEQEEGRRKEGEEGEEGGKLEKREKGGEEGEEGGEEVDLGRSTERLNFKEPFSVEMEEFPRPPSSG